MIDKKEQRPRRSPFSRRPREQKDEFESKLLDLARVTRVSAGGRRFRFRAVVIVGNKKGKVGVGVAKGTDVAQAVEKATRLAKKKIIEIPIITDTIPHQVYAKFGAAEVVLKPQRKGRGLVAGGTVRVICSLSGIKNISSKILGRTGNKLNNAQAAIKALKSLKVKKEAAKKPAKEIKEEKKEKEEKED
jgi:small subunit ribosomal protein S5